MSLLGKKVVKDIKKSLAETREVLEIVKEVANDPEVRKEYIGALKEVVVLTYGVVLDILKDPEVKKLLVELTKTGNEIAKAGKVK